MFKLFGRYPEPQATNDDTVTMALVMQRAQIGEIYAERLADGGENQAIERRYYENVRDELLDLLARMDDRHCREMATQSVVKMCMIAGDELLARALFARLEDRFLRQKILAAVPALGDPDDPDQDRPAHDDSTRLVVGSPDPKDGSVDVWPDGEDHGFSIRPDGDRFALCNRQGKWFECDSIEEGQRLLENLLKDGRSG